MPPFQNYFQQINQQNLNNQELQLQRQIEGLNAQLQQTQALKNQISQQYQQPYPQQPIQQQMPVGISTQIVEDFENISVNAIPMDNNGAFFVKRDGTEIQYRRWTGDGKISTTSYFPQNGNEVVNPPQDEIKPQNDALNEVVGVFNNRFDGVESRLTEIEQIIQPKEQPKSRNKSVKKEVVDDAE